MRKLGLMRTMSFSDALYKVDMRLHLLSALALFVAMMSCKPGGLGPGASHPCLIRSFSRTSGDAQSTTMALRKS